MTTETEILINRLEVMSTIDPSRDIDDIADMTVINKCIKIAESAIVQYRTALFECNFDRHKKVLYSIQESIEMYDQLFLLIYNGKNPVDLLSKLFKKIIQTDKYILKDIIEYRDVDNLLESLEL